MLTTSLTLSLSLRRATCCSLYDVHAQHLSTFDTYCSQTRIDNTLEILYKEVEVTCVQGGCVYPTAPLCVCVCVCVDGSGVHSLTRDGMHGDVEQCNMRRLGLVVMMRIASHTVDVSLLTWSFAYMYEHYGQG